MLNNYKKLSRQFRTLESKNEILNTQLKNSTDDIEIIDKLDKLREQLEEKESIMDRMLVEKEMIEQHWNQQKCH